MIDSTLRECPFCGNPAEVVEGEPFSFYPTKPTKRIRCISAYCVGHTVQIKFSPDLKASEAHARSQWNSRKRKNKITWNEDYISEKNAAERAKEQKQKNES